MPRASRRAGRGLRAIQPWGEDAKARFLTLLVDCGTFSGAIARLGRTRASAYAERAADPDFARAWDRALACEYEVMETRLVARALGVAEPAAPDAAMPAVRPEDLLVMWILALRSPPPPGPDRPSPGRPRAERPAKEVSAPADAAPGPAAEADRIEALIAGVAARIAATEAGGKD